MVSATLSSIRLDRISPTNATPNPIKTPAPRVNPKLRNEPTTVICCSPIDDSIIVKIMIAVASLNAASVSKDC